MIASNRVHAVGDSTPRLLGGLKQIALAELVLRVV